NLSVVNNFVLVAIVFILSISMSPYYIDGDQYHYRKVYEGLQGLSLLDGFVFYTLNLDSKEVVHFFLSWLGSNQGVDKDLLMAFSNSFLAYGTIMLLRKWKVSIFIIALLLLTNFYFYVLYFAAERLKFGFIFLTFSLLYIRYFYIFSVLSVIAHIQMSIVYLSMLFNIILKHITDTIRFKYIKKSFLYILVFLMIILPIIFFYLGTHFTAKFEHYSGEHNLFELSKIFIFFIFSLWYSKNRKEVIFLFLPLLMAVYLIGGERVNMIGYFVFLYYALPVKKGFNIGIIATSVYFLFASVGFTINILEYGNGFYEK
ncbi:MAG: hypothetical protein IE909_12095, partial [Campylobacterales bacterium]|nr:hypothetical protein [Campylobacterales bacterium]